jgi:Zn-dependent peptidase ImmA (M78 family)
VLAEQAESVVRGEHAASQLRLGLGLGLTPLTDLWEVIRSQGVDLAFREFGTDAGDGIYLWNGARALIVVNASVRPIARQRFTGAHELGHHMLHRDEGRPLLVADKDIFARDQDEVEKQANSFAAHLLAPTGAMRLFMPEKEPGEIDVRDVAEVMHDYGVSFQTAVFRLHNSGRIRTADRDRLLADGSGQITWVLDTLGYSEDDDVPRGRDLPPDYVFRVLSLHGSGVIDDDRLGELLRTDKETALALTKQTEETEATLPGDYAEILAEELNRAS